MMASLDLCLHLIRVDYGERIANIVSRRMVMPAHRDGGQARYVAAPVPARETTALSSVLDGLAADLVARRCFATTSWEG